MTRIRGNLRTGYTKKDPPSGVNAVDPTMLYLVRVDYRSPADAARDGGERVSLGRDSLFMSQRRARDAR